MSETSASAHLPNTTIGESPLHEHRLRQGSREWSVLHRGAVLTRADEARVIEFKELHLPYGVSLWPSAIALVHEIAIRPGEFAGRSVLELGAGVGLPGLVAASLAGYHLWNHFKKNPYR